MIASMENVVKRYGETTALDHFSMDVLEGEILGLLGPNGAGKTTAAQIERMTIVAECARIAREIHDSAGHEIVAAYISFQTARQLFGNADKETLELYDAALERLNQGTNKIRKAVHNLTTTTLIGVENL